MKDIILPCYIDKKLALEKNKFEYGDFTFRLTDRFYSKLSEEQKEVIHAFIYSNFNCPVFNNLDIKYTSKYNNFLITSGKTYEEILTAIDIWVEYVKSCRREMRIKRLDKIIKKSLYNKLPWYRKIFAKRPE